MIQNSNTHAAHNDVESGRRQYEAPRLTVHGDIQTITQGATTANSDGTMNST